MEKNALCLSLFAGQLQAVSLRRGAVEHSWQAPEPVEDLATLGAVVGQAITQTHASSVRAALVLVHPRLSQQVVETPPVSGAALGRFLHRRVQAVKSFAGAAAWSSQVALPTKKAEAFLIHMLPEEVLAQITRACANNGLELVRVLPTTSVLSSQLKALPIGRDEIALIAAATGPFTTVVIGRRDGQICHARVVASSWNEHPDRVAIDLSRTMGFVNEQAGLTVSSAWLFGDGAEAQVNNLANVLKLTTRLSPVPSTPFYWAEQAGLIETADDGNLVSAEVREAPQRRRLTAVTAFALLALLVVLLGISGYYETQRRAALKDIARTEADVGRVRARIDELTRREIQLQEKRIFTDSVRKETRPPTPGWFLGYMSEAVPDELILTQLNVTRANDRWRFTLDGALHPLTNAYPTSILHHAVATFSNALVTGAFRAQLQSVSPPGNPAKLQFQLQGTMP